MRTPPRPPSLKPRVPPPPPPRNAALAVSPRVERDEFPAEEAPTRRYADIAGIEFPAESAPPASRQSTTPAAPNPPEGALIDPREERPTTLSDVGEERTFWDAAPRYSTTSVHPPAQELVVSEPRSPGRNLIARVLFISLISFVLVLLVCEAKAAWLGAFAANSSAALG